MKKWIKRTGMAALVLWFIYSIWLFVDVLTFNLYMRRLVASLNRELDDYEAFARLYGENE